MLVVTAHAESTIDPRSELDSSQAVFYVGKRAMVCGTVFEVKPVSKGTHIYMGARYPNQHFSFLVLDSELHTFKEKFGGLGVFNGAQVCGRGLIENHKNNLQIKVSDPEFLHLIK